MTSAATNATIAATVTVASSAVSSSSTGQLGTNPYGPCLRPGACFEESACATASVSETCCNDGFVCSPICDGDVTKCPPPPDGFQIVCGEEGNFNGHCAILCNANGMCPIAMECAMGILPQPICVFIVDQQ